MAFDYTIRLKNRANEAQYHEFAKGTDIVSFNFELLRRGGCGAFSFTGVMDDWSAVETYMEPENIVQFYLDVNASLVLAYTGFVTNVDKEKSTPPNRTVRTVQGWGLWKQLSRDGCLVLKAYEDKTVYEIMCLLVAGPISDDTDCSSLTTALTSGATYNIAQTIFEDKTAADCIKKLAEVQTGMVYGVDEARRVFMQAETAAGAAPTLTVQLGDEDDGITAFVHTETAPGPNFYIVEGRYAPGGNPMTVVCSDVGANDRTRMKRVKAPELITGAQLQDWGNYLVAATKDAKVRVTLPITGIDDSTTGILDPNNNLTLNDENAALIAKYQIQALKYEMKGGSLDCTFELGNDPELDLLEDMGIREMLQEIRVHDNKMFSNTIELNAAGNSWVRWAGFRMVESGEMRNHIVFVFNGNTTDSSGVLDDEGDPLPGLIDWDSSYAIVRVTDRDALTSKRGGFAYGALVTEPIDLGIKYDKFAVLRGGAYPDYIGEREHPLQAFYRKWLSGDDSHMGWRIIDDGIGATSDPFPASYSGLYHSAQFLDNPFSLGTKIKWTFQWDLPSGGSSVDRFYIYDGWVNKENHRYLEMYGLTSPNRLHFAYGRKRTGYATDWAFTGENLNVSDGDVIEATVDRALYSDGAGSHTGRVKITFKNTETDQTISKTSATGFIVQTEEEPRDGFAYWHQQNGTQYNFSNWTMLKAEILDVNWTQDNCWISRDNEHSWEGPLNCGTGAALDLGAYAGGGTQQAEVRVLWHSQNPRYDTGLALGWSDPSA